MADQEIIDYIKQGRSMGMSDEAARQKLAGVGHHKKDIDDAFAELAETKETATKKTTITADDLIPHPVRGLDSVSILFKKAWLLYLQKFNELTAIMAPPVFLGLAAAYVIHAKLGSFAVLAVLFTAMGVVYLASALAIVFALHNKTGFVEAYSYAFKNFLSFLWTTILSRLVILGGFVLAVIPGAKYAISFSMLPFTFVGENERGLAASLKSREYVEGLWFRTLWRTIVVALVFIVVTVLVGSSVNFLTGTSIVGLNSTQCVGTQCISAGTQNAAGGYLTTLVTSLLQLVYVPFAMAYLYLIYRNFMQIKPQLVSVPVSAKRGFYVFCAILGVFLVIASMLLWAIYVLLFKLRPV